MNLRRKATAFSILFVLLFSNQYAQFFALLPQKAGRNYMNVLREPRDGNYRVVNCRYSNFTTILIKNQILVFNQSLQLTDSINLVNGMIPIGIEPLKIGNRLLWPMIMRDTINSSQQQKLIISEFSSTYQYITL